MRNNYTLATQLIFKGPKPGFHMLRESRIVSLTSHPETSNREILRRKRNRPQVGFNPCRLTKETLKIQTDPSGCRCLIVLYLSLFNFVAVSPKGKNMIVLL